MTWKSKPSDHEILILLYFKDIWGYDKQDADNVQLQNAWIGSDNWLGRIDLGENLLREMKENQLIAWTSFGCFEIKPLKESIKSWGDTGMLG